MRPKFDVNKKSKDAKRILDAISNAKYQVAEAAPLILFWLSLEIETIVNFLWLTLQGNGWPMTVCSAFVQE